MNIVIFGTSITVQYFFPHTPKELDANSPYRMDKFGYYWKVEESH